MRIPAGAAILVLIAGLFGLVVACDKPTPVAPIDSTLEISANPTRIGIDETSEITIFAREGDGTPVNEGTEVNLSTTIGSIEAVVRTNDRGVATATLQGEGQAGTADVTARSGAAGAATIQVQVGSLAGSITLTATPNFVNKNLPPAGATISLVAVVEDDLGVALRNANVTFLSDVGVLASGGVSVSTDASGVATDTLTVNRADLANLTDDFFEVRAQTAGGAGGEGGGTRIESIVEIQIGGAPATLFFQATPTSVPETGGAVSLVASVVDNLGDPLPGTQVRFFTDLGTLSLGTVETNGAGDAVDTLTLTEAELTSFGGSQFTVRAQIAGIGGEILEQTATIRIQTGAPRAIFSADDSLGGLTVRFTNLSTGQAPLTCVWDFGAGASPGAFTGCFAIPDVVYSSTGSKTVRLEVSNAIGTDSTSTVVNPQP